MNEEDEILSNTAIEFIKKEKRKLIEKFANDKQYPSVNNPVSAFMAGSPGAGKTEFSKRLINDYLSKDGINGVVRIDPDDIRLLLPGYTGKNSSVFQRAATIGVEKLVDYSMVKNKNFVLDGTLFNFDVACKNIDRSLKHKRIVLIVYVYQDPIVAWGFTQKREALEKRNIPKDAFIEQFLSAKNTVNRLKEKYGDQTQIWLIEKNFEQNMERLHLNIDKIDNYLKFPYSKKEDLETLI
ncbi:MAG: zeta toxin family protein [Patescibacteria group bacterium]|jgi:hypothetical protein